MNNNWHSIKTTAGEINIENGNFSGDIAAACAFIQAECDKTTIGYESFGHGYGELTIGGKKYDISPYGIDINMMLGYFGKNAEDFQKQDDYRPVSMRP